jgi:D-serine deaminase-like pyridoxal phosphate-dependent protein
VDAGSKSVGLEVADLGAGPVFGLVRDRPTVALRSVYEEHGILGSSDPDALPEIGDSVRIVPAHCCVAVNLHDSLHVAARDEVVDRWTIVARGCVR